MVEVIPAILTNDVREAEAKLHDLEVFVPRIQIDIIDGAFAANKSIDPSAVEYIETDLLFDFHLMTKEPTDWVERCVRGGGDRIIGQIEKMTDQLEFIGKVQETGLEVGLALDIDTPVSDINEEALASIDAVLVMGYPAGAGGQPFDEKALKKIKELAEIRKEKNLNFKICLDGGVNLDNIGKIVEAGTDEVAVGKSLFVGNLEENITKLKNA
jgi:ribulose-phosphate 3-epimerase